MRKKRKMTDEFLNEIFRQVSSYQNEHNCMIREAIEAIRNNYDASYATMEKWYYMSPDRKKGTHSAAKKKTGRPKKTTQTKIAATSISTQLDAEKAIFEYVKKLGFFKRILACIIGLDKLCYNYGSQSLHTTRN